MKSAGRDTDDASGGRAHGGGSPRRAAARPLMCSWVVNAGWEHHQRLELENDLIAAWVLATGSPPSAQFSALG